MFKKIALSTLIITINSTSFAANVSNVSAESFAQYGKEDAYWVVSVTCDDNDTERTVQRKTDQDTWCPKGNDLLCSDDKQVAYKNACSSAYYDELQKARRKKQQIKRAQQAKAQKRLEQQLAVQQQKEELEINESLLKIEEQRLNLSKRHLEIEGRITEIDNILEDDEE